MSSRADRRRKRRSGKEEPPAEHNLPFGRTTRIALGFLAIGIATVAVVGLIISSIGGGDNKEAAVANTNTSASSGTTSPTGTTGPTATIGGSAQDEADIRTLAERSIEVLPAGQWPSLYDDFTLEFRGRCDLAVFTQAGVDSANSLGNSLELLEFKELKGLEIRGSTASGTIVGRERGIDGSDYDIQAAFALEDGRWKIAPAPGTTGCSAFNQLNG